MLICTIHAHSSEESARKCLIKRHARNAKIKARLAGPRSRNVIVRHTVPRRVLLKGGVELFVFQEGNLTPY